MGRVSSGNNAVHIAGSLPAAVPPQTIMVVGGQPGTADWLRARAPDQEITPLSCETAAAMLRLLETLPPVALIVLDQGLPESLATLRQLSADQRYRSVPVLLLLEVGELDAFRSHGRTLDQVDYLLKPLEAPVVRQRLSCYLARGRCLHELDLLTDQQRLTVDVMGRMLEKRKSSEMERDKFKRILDAARDTVLMFEVGDFPCIYANDGASLEFGYSREEWLDLTLDQLQDNTARAETMERLGAVLKGNRVSDTIDTEFLHKDGGKVPVRVFMQCFQEPVGNELLVCFVTNITDYVEQTAALEYQSLHDGLTGLPNRTLFRDRLSHAVANARRFGEEVGVFMMDLDRFKEVNDTLGHHVGDALLQQVGQVLTGVLRETDTVARLGGDEFAVLIENTRGLESLIGVAEKIAAAIRGPFVVEGQQLNVGISIGIVRFPFDGDSETTLMRRADVAMYEAKRRRIDYAVYEVGQDKDKLLLLTLESEFRHAIQSGQLELYYQPKIEVASSKLVGMEALVRWNHPEKGMVPPDAFIAMAERSGLIIPLTGWVIEQAMRQCALWDEKGYEMKIAVNLSTRNLMDVDLPHLVRQGLEKWGINPWQLTFEVTESDIMEDSQRVLKVMDEINGMGVRFAVDDFGTGYSSLAYLKKLPVSELKIDKSFISNMAVDGDDMVIAHSTIQMAHHLGLEVVAEGVENRQIWELLSVLRCDVAQGYYFSRPLPVDEAEPWVRRGVFQPEDRTPPGPPQH